MDGVGMVRRVAAYLQQQRYRKLRYGCRAVGWNVRDGYPLLARIHVIDWVIPRRLHGDILHVRARIQNAAAYRGFICNDDLGGAYAADYLRLILGAVIVYYDVAEGAQPVPTQVAGVFCVSIYYGNLHSSPPIRHTESMRIISDIIRQRFSSAAAAEPDSVVSSPTLSTA